MSHPVTGKWVKVTATGFNNQLSATDINAQLAFSTLDQHVHGIMDVVYDYMLWYASTNRNSYAYRNGVLAYDRLFSASTVVAWYIYNSTARNHTIDIYKNGVSILSKNMNTLTYYSASNLGLSYSTGDTLAIYCSGTQNPTNEQVVLFIKKV